MDYSRQRTRTKICESEHKLQRVSLFTCCENFSFSVFVFRTLFLVIRDKTEREG